MHKILGTSDVLSEILAKGLKKTKSNKILDMCSGSGGPMLDVAKTLKEKHGVSDLQLTLSDLYPNDHAAAQINNGDDSSVSYITSPVDATDIHTDKDGMRTMVCSMHHMRPETAKAILKDAKDAKRPICIYEISDNAFPIWIWWVSIPITFIMTFFITPLVRPMSWQQVVFTYIIPVLPLFIAWDGAVSNARTYTLKDWDIILEDLQSDDYTWEKDTVKGKGGNKIYLLGYPT